MSKPLLMAAALAAAVPLADAQPPSFAALDAAIDRAIAQQRIVGAVVLVAHGGQVVYRRAAGLADREQRRPMREDAIFRLSSVTKPMVSAAALRLVEQGRLDLQAPVTRWLPDFRPQMPDGSMPVITLHQLLTHTAGLSYGLLEPADGPYRRAGISDGLDDAGITLEENLRRIAGVPLAYPPGQGWRYSVALDVLGAVMEAATGSDLSLLLRQHVTGPLHMPDTGFRVVDGARLATPYQDAQDGGAEPQRMAPQAQVPFGEGRIRFAPDRVWDAGAYPSGGAGMVGTAPDFMQFLLSLRPGAMSRLLKPETVALMLRDHAGVQAQTQGPGWGFGYGWSVLVDPALAGTPQGKGTIQWGGVYGHSWFVDPVHDLAVLAFTNTAIEGMSGAFAQDVRDAVYAALLPVAAP
ncbi:class A beta-lactamase-related serine hydrolase [Corticibacter populi]|uniref:Class A beta-lactamase-related serine hydrolase n=1 Tax=Corticibacter populi TaxID=1550736 RepID=A0A3M6QPK3_9BURK|nr:serine hydrolase domain-containing protein [Corticibacter populi]RMX05000.1 class A beta-lactamase-related serine hydrolase [Corticibacter populi]